MTISSINAAMSSSWGAYVQKLTEDTKMQLEQLGIPYSKDTTEQEAQTLLRQVSNFKSNSSENNQFLNNKQQQKNDLYEKAATLAKKIGIQVEENESFQTLIAKIENVLEQKITSNGSNEDLLKELKGYSQELASIQAQSTGSSGYDNTNQALMLSLEMLAQYNRNFMKD